MIKECEICNTEFETVNPNQKYCSKDCRKERIRRYDRDRKRKARQEARKIKNAELEHKRKEKELEERKYQKELEQKQERLVAKAKRGDPWARMQLAKPFSAEYWEAYKEYAIRENRQLKTNYTRYVNGISIFDDEFTEKVMIMVEELGVIHSELRYEAEGNEALSKL